MKLPNIKLTNSARQYFEEFYALNRDDAEFSHRKFADKLNWPASYLGDVIVGRKPVSLARALEFSKYFGFSVLETERFIGLALAGAENPAVAAYFTAWLPQNLDIRDQNAIAAERDAVDTQTERLVDPKILQDPSLAALHMLITWAGGAYDIYDLAELLVGFPELQNRNILDDKLRELEKMNLIRKNSAGVFELVDLRCQYTSLGLVREAQCQLPALARLLDFPELRGLSKVGYAVVPKGKLIEMSERIAAFQNWLLKCREPSTSPHDNVIIRYDFFLNHALDLSKLGYQPLDVESNLSDQKIQETGFLRTLRKKKFESDLEAGPPPSLN